MQDLFHAFIWILVAHGVGAALWPLTARVFPYFQDRGVGFAIPFGMLLYGLVCRVVWSLNLLNPSPAFHLMILGVVAALSWGKLPPRNVAPRTLRRIQKRGITASLVFTGSFLFWLLIRAHDPGVSHTEQPMDLMLIQTSLHSSGSPMEDPWLSGQAITYYTGGHLLLAHVAQLAGSPAEQAVNFGQAMWFALASVLVFQIAGLWRSRKAQGFSTASAWIALLFVMWSSNLAGALDVIKGRTTDDWWWWNATRCIQDPGPDGNPVNLITEFPFFSFWLGDNHAHVLSLPFLLLAIAVALHVQRRRTPHLFEALALGACLGMSWVSNAWQVPTIAAILFLALFTHPNGFRRSTIWWILAAMVAALLPAAPSLLQTGASMFQGIAFTPKEAHSSFQEKLLVFGLMLPAALLIVVQGWRRMPFAMSLLILSGCILMVCDHLMIVDLFRNRMNTVFKAYYQVWMLLGLLAGVGAGQMLHHRSRIRKLIAATAILPLFLAVLYPAILCGNALGRDPQPLDATQSLPEEWRSLVAYGQARIRPGDLIIEAEGESYSADTSVLSTWTAGGTLIGWTGHEHQWHPTRYNELLVPKMDATRACYEAHTEPELEAWLETQQPDWVLLGPREHAIYAIHPDWPVWMADRFDRPIHSEWNTLYRRRR